MKRKRKKRPIPRPSWTVRPEVVEFDKGVDLSLITDLIDDAATVMESGETYKRCRARWVARVELASGPVVVKHFTERSIRHTLKQRFQRSRARRAADKAFRFVEFGFHTPRPLALLQEQIGPFRGNSTLVYEYIDGMTLLEGPWKMIAPVAAEHGQSTLEYIRQRVEDTRDRLIELNLAHGDCHVGNFMFDRQGRLYVLDLDAIGPALLRKKNIQRLEYLFQLVDRGVEARIAADAA